MIISVAKATRKKQIFYGQSDRKGGGGVSPLNFDHKEMLIHLFIAIWSLLWVQNFRIISHPVPMYGLVGYAKKREI